MKAVKFFVVRFKNKKTIIFYLDTPSVVRSFCNDSDAHEFAKRLNNRFPQYFYCVFNLDQLNKLGILPF